MFFLLDAPAFGQEVGKIKITALEQTIARSETPLIVNFWATYCKPCMAEMPGFERLAKKYAEQGVRLLLVSLDMEEDFGKIKGFVSKRRIQSPVSWLDETDADYFCPKVDPKWSGAIPATLFINNKTGYRNFIEEPLTEERLEKEIMAILGEGK